ncbi:MAG TPA: FAD-binding oxidoreductase, partial [Planctomycetes bacterium]|nr:FAD-binding oxidoreductase [Planctomycetota bacterium]
EHGVGLEKQAMMSRLFTPDDLSVMERVRRCLDPDMRLNPGKMFPVRSCKEVRPRLAGSSGESV